MKRYGTIWMLCARSTVNKLLALLVLMAVSQWAVLWLAIGPDRWGAPQFMERELSWVGLSGPVSVAAFVIFLLWALVLAMPSLSRASGTLDRLPVSKAEFYFNHALYCLLGYGVLWAAQAAFFLGVGLWMGRSMDPEFFGPQSLLIDSCSNPFLHSLVPLRDMSRLAGNVVVLVGLSLATASAHLGLRKSGAGLLPLGLSAALMFFFPASMGEMNHDLLLAMVSLILGLAGTGMALQRADEYEEESYESN